MHPVYDPRQCCSHEQQRMLNSDLVKFATVTPVEVMDIPARLE